jgi:serine phosphatase RsbU (regulator of sigma subunit)
LNTAAEIQDFFLTKNFPELESYKVSALTQPAYDVGGDWYDAFAIDGHSFFVVADVCDKGVGSALFMSVFRTLIRYTTKVFYARLEISDTSQALIDIITGVNKYVSNNHGGCMYFATVFFAHIHEDTNVLNYVSSGHESVLIKKVSGEHVLLNATGPALGLFPTAKYTSGSCSFESGDTLLAYTDGVTDARNNNEQSYGIERLRNVFDQIDCLSVEDMRDRLMLELTEFMDGAEQFDDITMMFLRRLPVHRNASDPAVQLSSSG